MVVALLARERSVLLLHRGLCPHDARKILWIVCTSSRSLVGIRGGHHHFDDGNGVLGVCLAIWSDVLVGCDRDYELCVCGSIHR